MTVQEIMQEKLTHELEPTRLQLTNVSHQHAGHAGSPGSGHSHFELVLESPRFAGLSRVQRHKLVYGVLAAEMAGPVHALQLTLLAPGE